MKKGTLYRIFAFVLLILLVLIVFGHQIFSLNIDQNAQFIAPLLGGATILFFIFIIV